METLPKKLRLQLATNANNLLAKIFDEPLSEQLTKTEEDFFKIIFNLCNISFAYKCLADSYMKLYHFARKEKIFNPEFMKELKTKYPIDWESFNWG